MAATIYDDSTPLEEQSLEELEAKFAAACTELNEVQIDQVKKGNEAMIAKFPKMQTAHAIYEALLTARAVSGIRSII